MARLIALTALFSLSLIATLAPAHAEKRAALVIGVNDYAEVDDLEKAVGDARAMAAKLATLGFDVTQVLDPDRLR